MRVLRAVFLLLLPLSMSAAPSVVTVSGHQLIVQKRLGDGSLGPAAPYIIRGVVWSPASDTTNTYPDDPNNVSVRRAEFALWASSDITLMATMHVNTVRLLIDPGVDAPGISVLDQLYANGIMAIMTVDNGSNDTTRISEVVAHYKDHPGILMWMLGNEWNINRYYTNPKISVLEAAQRTESAAQLIKSIDSGHPIVSSYGDIDINDAGMHLADTQVYVNTTCPTVDVWGLNIYRGNSFGTLFAEWASITTKPMFIGEFGTDVLRTAGAPPNGSEDPTMQSDWTLAEWDDLFGHLSANVPEAVAIGGVFFEWNDEWWKVKPTDGGSPTVHDRGSTTLAQHPDGHGNEEFFGVVDVHRNQRALYVALQTAFDPAYVPPATRPYRVISRGYDAQEYTFENGTVWIFKDGAKLFSITGGSSGRGFNVAVIDPSTEALQQSVQHFDTWSSANLGTNEFCDMDTFLGNVADEMLLLVGVADDTGLNYYNQCVFQNTNCAPSVRSRLAALGSQQIENYCYRDSLAIAAVKGQTSTLIEQRAHGDGNFVLGEAQARILLPKITRTLSASISGSGALRSVPAGVSCTPTCSAPFPLNASVRVFPIADVGWRLSEWTGPCGSPGCTVTMTDGMAVQATFIAFPPPASIEAHYTGTAATITWPSVIGAVRYDIERSADGSTYVTAGSSTSTNFADAAIAPDQAFLYRVRARSEEGGASHWSAADLMTAVTFTDDPLVAQSTRIQAVHLAQLRIAVNAVRALAGLSATAFTDPNPLGVPVRAAHVTEMRTALAAARASLALSTLTFTHPTLTANVSTISAADFAELREGMR